MRLDRVQHIRQNLANRSDRDHKEHQIDVVPALQQVPHELATVLLLLAK